MQKTVYIVQHFDRRDRRVVEGRAFRCSSSFEAMTRAAREAGRSIGVVAFSLVVDAATEMPADKPKILAEYGEVPKGFRVI